MLQVLMLKKTGNVLLLAVGIAIGLSLGLARGVLADKPGALGADLPWQDARMLAAVLERPVAKEIGAAALTAGLLVNAVRPDAVRVAPPLLVTDAEVDEALAILAGALDSTTARND